MATIGQMPGNKKVGTYKDALSQVNAGLLGGSTSGTGGALRTPGNKPMGPVAGGLSGKPTSYIAPNGQKQLGVFTGESGAPANTYAGAQGRQVTDANGQTDIGTKIKDSIDSGLSYKDVQDLLNQRNDKISGNEGQLGKYKNDAVTKAAEDYIRQGQFDENFRHQQEYFDKEAAAREAAIRAKVEQAVGKLEAQKGTVEQSYGDLFRQLYMDRRKAEVNLPQQMAAMGYTGGLAETSALNLQTGYRDALRQGEQQKTTTLSDIEKAITDARLTGDISIAEQAAQLANQGLLSYTELMKELRNQQTWDKEFSYKQDYDNQQQENWLKNMNRQEIMDQLSRADISDSDKRQAAQYLYEKTGDASGLAVLGYTPGQIADLEKSYSEKLAQGGSGGGSGTKKPVLSLNDAISQYNGGVDSPSIKNSIEYYLQIPFDQWVAGVDPQESDSYKKVKDSVGNLLYNYGRGGADNTVLAQRAGDFIRAQIASGAITQAEGDVLGDYVAGLMK